MTVLVTGATGELGQLLVQRLRLEGKSVRVLTRRPYLASCALPQEICFFEWHPAVEEPPVAAFEGIDTVVHLMGEPVLGAGDADYIARYVGSRVTALERIADGLRGRTWRLVLVSVAPTSGQIDSVITEASQRDAMASRLDSAVVAVEAAGQSARSAGANVVIVRLGLLLTRRGAVFSLARDARHGRLPNLLQSRIPAIDPEDAAAMLAGLVDRLDIEGIVHGVAPAALDGRELMLALAAMSSWRLPRHIPRTRRSVFGRYGFLAPLLFNKGRIVPQRLVEMGAEFAHPDPNSTVLRLLAEIQRETAESAPWWLTLRQALKPPRVIQDV